MRNNDYFSLINFKIKLHRQKKSLTMKFYFEINYTQIIIIYHCNSPPN